MKPTERHAAIVLAAGQGRRMNSAVQKQYMLLGEKPVLWYSLQTFEQTEWIQEIVLVTAPGEEDYCRKEIVEKFGFQKVTMLVPGGRERYESVAFGLRAMEASGRTFDYVYIHDGARPFLNQEILERAYLGVKRYQACAVGMPSKDTVKIADEQQNIAHTPLRSRVWSVQTPQVFAFELASKAYALLMENPVKDITDDAMVVETYLKKPVHLIEGSYRNIKITTPEDLPVAEALLAFAGR